MFLKCFTLKYLQKLLFVYILQFYTGVLYLYFEDCNVHSAVSMQCPQCCLHVLILYNCLNYWCKSLL